MVRASTPRPLCEPSCCATSPTPAVLACSRSPSSPATTPTSPTLPPACSRPPTAAPPPRPCPRSARAAGLVFALRPLGVSGPYLRGYGYYRQQFQATDRDFGNFGGQAGWRAGRGDRYLFADYAFDASLLGGSPFLYAHRLRGGGRWQIRRVGLTAVYGARFGSYQTIDSAPYSGILQTVDADISIRFWLVSVAVLGYHAGRDAANAPEAASWEHGPRAAVRFVLLPTLSVSADAAWLWLPFDAPAPGSSVARSDRVLHLAAAAEKDFANRFTLRLSVSDRTARSNLSAYSYSRITATLALSYTLGLFSSMRRTLAPV